MASIMRQEADFWKQQALGLDYRKCLYNAALEQTPSNTQSPIVSAYCSDFHIVLMMGFLGCQLRQTHCYGSIPGLVVI
jgi:hypothetical protein